MLHLHTERLAALGDEQPTAEEAAHLAACDACARERDAYQTLVAMAHAERELFGLPLTRWDAIATALALPAAQPANTRRPRRWALQIAAGLLLVAGGAMAGRVSVGARPLPTAAVTATNAAVNTPVQPVARLDPDSTFFNSVDEARIAQQRSELVYQQAAAFLATHDTTGVSDSQVAYRSRLTALDRVLSTTREAMRQAPHDPVINGYYLTTLGQREATLRQLNTALPVSLRVNSF